MDKVKELAGLLVSVDQYETVEKLYAASRAAQMQIATRALSTELSRPMVSAEAAVALLSAWQVNNSRVPSQKKCNT